MFTMAVAPKMIASEGSLSADSVMRTFIVRAAYLSILLEGYTRILGSSLTWKQTGEIIDNLWLLRSISVHCMDPVWVNPASTTSNVELFQGHSRRYHTHLYLGSSSCAFLWSNCDVTHDNEVSFVLLHFIQKIPIPLVCDHILPDIIPEYSPKYLHFLLHWVWHWITFLQDYIFSSFFRQA
jgi:hypothetical protein